MLILSRKRGESFFINDDIELIVTDISGDQVRIGVRAPANVKVLRKELVQTIESNRRAVRSHSMAEMRELLTKLENH